MRMIECFPNSDNGGRFSIHSIPYRYECKGTKFNALTYNELMSKAKACGATVRKYQETLYKNFETSVLTPNRKESEFLMSRFYIATDNDFANRSAQSLCGYWKPNQYYRSNEEDCLLSHGDYLINLWKVAIRDYIQAYGLFGPYRTPKFNTAEDIYNLVINNIIDHSYSLFGYRKISDGEVFVQEPYTNPKYKLANFIWQFSQTANFCGPITAGNIYNFYKSRGWIIKERVMLPSLIEELGLLDPCIVQDLLKQSGGIVQVTEKGLRYGNDGLLRSAQHKHYEETLDPTAIMMSISNIDFEDLAKGDRYAFMQGFHSEPQCYNVRVQDSVL